MDYDTLLVYDKEKYKEMLLDASETVLGIFGFDRTLKLEPSRLNLRVEQKEIMEQPLEHGKGCGLIYMTKWS